MKLYGLSKTERIKSRKDFEKIYSSGTVIFSSDNKIKAIFLIDKNNPEKGLKFGAAVSKRAGNAVWRNRVKRLLRESFRLNKHLLLEQCLKKNILIYLVFSPNQFNQQNKKYIKLNHISSCVVDILDKLNKRLINE